MQVIIEFLKTGRYRWWVPFISSVRFTDARAPTANDFVGLNYYRSAASCLLAVTATVVVVVGPVVVVVVTVVLVAWLCFGVGWVGAI